jgi:hypothetical protein
LEVRVLPGSPLLFVSTDRACTDAPGDCGAHQAMQVSRLFEIGNFLQNLFAIYFTPVFGLPDAPRFIVSLSALSCKIPTRTALVRLSCGRPSRWPPDLLLHSAGRNVQFANLRR